MTTVPEENPNSLLMRQTMSGAQHAKYNLEKERELEKIQQRLQEEFAVLDRNRDGSITLEEIR